MSVKDEQLQEIEALSSIYPDELTVLSEDPFPQFQLIVKATADEKSDLKPFLELSIEFHEHYPDEAPTIRITNSEHVDDVSWFEAEIDKVCQENLGMPVIFTLASHLCEQLTIQAETRQTREREARERKEREEEEAEQKRFEGTRVTVESFIKWKVKFDAELAELTKVTKVEDTEPKKLSGRQLFEKDRSLYDSDIKFISGEGGEVVEVDESLFEEMIDLDMEEGGATGIDLSDLDT